MSDRALRWMGRASRPDEPHAEDAGARATTGGGPGDGVGPVCVGVVEGPLRAEIARTYMEQAGLQVFLQGEPIANVYGFASGPLGQVRVLVPAAQAEEAVRIFAELDFSSVGEERAEP